MGTDTRDAGHRTRGATQGGVTSRSSGADGDSHRGVASPAPAAPITRVRGQTTLDFSVGMGLFIISLIFVLTFVPGILDPFTAGTQEETTAVDRVADELSQRLLGNATEPYKLDVDCTRTFFQSGTVGDCPFSGTELTERLSIEDTKNVNVTITGNVSGTPSDGVLCLSDTSTALSERPCGGTETGLATGPSPSGSGGKTVSARRVVVLSDHDVTIEVEMW